MTNSSLTGTGVEIAPVAVASLQFAGMSRAAFFESLSRLNDPITGSRVFRGVELGPAHFDPAGIMGADAATVKQQLFDDCGDHGFLLPDSGFFEVSFHPVGMGILGKCMHPGWEGFLGDRVWTALPSGMPNEAEINEKAFDECVLATEAVAEVGGADLNMFFSSSIEPYERQFPHVSAAPKWAREMMEADAARIAEFCEKSKDGVYINVEPHPGEWFWGLWRMIEFLRECYKHSACRKKLRLKFDPSHPKMHGYCPAAFVRELTVLQDEIRTLYPDFEGTIIRKIHWKWSSFTPGGTAGTDNVDHLGPRNGKRAGMFIAMQYGSLEEQSEVWCALQQHGIDPYNIQASVEHEMDELEALDSAKEIEPALNCCLGAGLHVFQYLRGVLPGGSHQDRMQTS